MYYILIIQGRLNNEQSPNPQEHHAPERIAQKIIKTAQAGNLVLAHQVPLYRIN